MRPVVRPLAVIVLLGLTLGCAKPMEEVSRDAETHYIYGVSYLREGNQTNALKEFLRAVEIAPDDPKFQAALGQAYHLKGAHALAEEHYLKSLKLAANDPQVNNNLGALYLDMQLWQKAIERFRVASGNLLFASPEISLTGMGVAQYNLGQYLDAVDSCKRALLANPQYGRAHFFLGEAYVALNKDDLAIKAYLDALKLSPAYAPARYRLALAYMREENREKAREEFREVLRLAPDSEEARLASEYLAILK